MPRRRPRRRRARRSEITDYMRAALTPNTFVELKVKSTKLPTNRAFRLICATVTVASNFPCVVQVEMYNANAGIASTSGPIVVGTNTTKIVVHNPDRVMLPAGINAETKLLQVVCSCEDKSLKGNVVLAIALKIQLGPEVLDSSCPKLVAIPLDNDEELEGYITCLSS